MARTMFARIKANRDDKTETETLMLISGKVQGAVIELESELQVLYRTTQSPDNVLLKS